MRGIKRGKNKRGVRMNDYKHFQYQEEDDLIIFSLNSPPVNALSTSLIEELDRGLNSLVTDQKKALIIASSLEKYFIAGANIKEIKNLHTEKETKDFLKKGKNLLDKIEGLDIPCIAAVNGFCLGGGMELAMACHFRVAGESASFGQPEINLGIIPGFGGTQRLARIAGCSKALELILTGDHISAVQAESVGLANKVVPDESLLKQTKEFAQKITAKGKPSIEAAIRAVVGGLKRSFEDGMKLETYEFARLVNTEDKNEGIQAFLEKREPEFKDR